jgi:PPM family protein phosphatase
MEALRPLDTQVPAGELLNALDHAVRRTDSTLRDMAQANPSLLDMGTTMTALLWSGSQLGLVHVGDSRAYLVRGDEVFQIPRPHDGAVLARRREDYGQRSRVAPTAIPAAAGAGGGPQQRTRPYGCARPAWATATCSAPMASTRSPTQSIARVLLTVSDPARPPRTSSPRP